MILILFAGLGAGAIHVLSGPDHLAALAPLAAKEPRRGVRLGLNWGIGHSFGVALIGLCSLWLRELLPLETLSFWAERLVGGLLIGIGIWGLRNFFCRHIHEHRHEHGEQNHSHLHFHGPGGTIHRGHSHAAFYVGTLHGLAGSAHLFGILPAIALPTFSQGAMFLGAYCVGTIASMIGFTGMLGWLLQRRQDQSWLRPALGWSSATAVVMGLFWVTRV